MLYNDIERELSQLDPFSFEKLVVTLLDFEGYHISIRNCNRGK